MGEVVDWDEVLGSRGTIAIQEWMFPGDIAVASVQGMPCGIQEIVIQYMDEPVWHQAQFHVMMIDEHWGIAGVAITGHGIGDGGEFLVYWHMYGKREDYIFR